MESPPLRNIFTANEINDAMFKRLNALSADKKRLADNVFSLSLLQAANYLLPLIAIPYLVRMLGAERFGAVMFAQALIQYFILFSDFGFNLSAPREIAIQRDDHQAVNTIFNGVLWNKLLLGSAGFAVLLGLVLAVPRFRQDVWLYILTFGMVYGNALFPQWFFQGMERMRFITLLNILAKSVFTFSLFLFVHRPADYLRVPILNSAGYLIAGGVGIYLAVTRFGMTLQFPGIATLRHLLKDSAQFFLSRLSVSLYTTSNAFVLGLFTNNTIVGYYTAAEKLYIALQSAYQPLVNALYPYVARYRNVRFFKKIFYFATSANVLICVLLIAAAPWIIQWLYGSQMAPSIAVFRLLILVAVVVVPSILLGYPFLAALDFPQYANGTVVLGSMVHLIGLTLLAITGHVTLTTVPLLLAITESTVFFSRVGAVMKFNLWRTP